jgi:multidrug efflux pump subunit AcrB
VIIGGLLSRLLLSVFLSPVLYSLAAKDDDVLRV